ncbi:hypothetical protein ACO22_00875 [Paracoccidioides brasiliensis]|uniref:Uncharacterized protein n=1 Tax=Paracoccidioides brasiliensis TaxID=121759 RepID=A0A1D2JN41_PARBR|nr:hypothetical protein ACO22_00875 [Paracoccidioides brasiliensis]
MGPWRSTGEIQAASVPNSERQITRRSMLTLNIYNIRAALPKRGCSCGNTFMTGRPDPGSRKTGPDEVDHMHYHRPSNLIDPLIVSPIAAELERDAKIYEPLPFAPNFDEAEGNSNGSPRES